MLPKKLDEKVARLHLGKLGVKLETLTKDQAELPRRVASKVRTSPSTTATEFPSGMARERLATSGKSSTYKSTPVAFPVWAIALAAILNTTRVSP